MNEDKRKIIVNEIEYWRKSKLLPEQYCDFLHNLYSDQPAAKQSGFIGLSAKAISESHMKVWLLAFGILVFFSISAFNFTLFPAPAQIAVVFAAVCGLFYVGMRSLTSNHLRGIVFIGAGFCMMLFAGQAILSIHGFHSSAWTLGYALINCLLWLFIGFALKLPLFQFCGWIGILSFYGWLLYEYGKMEKLWQMELGWIPMSVLFIWSGWLAQHRDRGVGMVLLSVGLILWFAAEIYAAAADAAALGLIQSVFVVKILIAGLTLFGSRKNWIKWVTG